MNRIFSIAVIAIGILVLTTIVVLLLPRLWSSEAHTQLLKAFTAGLIIAVCIIPALVWLVFKNPLPGEYSAHTLEEISLSEEELTEAVRNWVYLQHNRRMEHELRLLEDDEGNISCRVTVRKE